MKAGESMDGGGQKELLAAGPILREVARQYEDYQARWIVEVLEEGPGALVFMEGAAPVSGPEGEGDFWSLASLRRFLREEGQCDEFVCRWLSECESKATIPVVVCRHYWPPEEGGSRLSFFTVCRPIS
jgi:hypothetical protein